jgi:hypothetical protein
LQVKPQDVPLQVGVAFWGIVHAEQEVVPQLAGLLLETHCVLQMCCPESQVQAFALGMQASMHSFMPLGQVGVQVVPSQVALPPLGI